MRFSDNVHSHITGHEEEKYMIHRHRDSWTITLQFEEMSLQEFVF